MSKKVKRQRFEKGHKQLLIPRAIDVFCGIGGLSHGLLRSNVRIVAGIDIDRSCQFAFETNNRAPFICKSITDVTGQQLKRMYPKNSFKILVGCAPCQPFSSHTNKSRNSAEDKRWNLLLEFLRLVKEIRPDVVSMENVLQIRKYDVFEQFVKGLKKLKYHVDVNFVYCPEYGIPQNRKRLVLLASKSKKHKIKLISATHNAENYMTVEKVIGKLPKVNAGQSTPSDPLHVSAGMTKINLQRMKASIPGGTWEDWPKSLILNCHKKSTGKSYKSVYGRMEWNKPAPTITTQFYNYGTGRFGHPEQNRALTLREGAMLQTFPADYQILPDDSEVNMTEIARHIGNAVPVRLGEVIAQSIFEHKRALKC